MFTLSKQFTFEASHVLTHHKGKCSNMHGHRWELFVLICGSDIGSLIGPNKNMLLDFSDISKAVRPMIEAYFDHKHLNDTLCTDSPTSEYIARWVYEYLKPNLAGLNAVIIKETETSGCRYHET